MPTAPGSRCTEPGCGTITTTGRCPQHTRKPWANPSANTRTLTGRQRHNLHRAQTRREPQCRVCGTTKNLEADHIVPIAAGGAWFDPANLQTLCTTHHEEKTAWERLQRRNQPASQH